jgi:hypothetical protein
LPIRAARKMALLVLRSVPCNHTDHCTACVGVAVLLALRSAPCIVTSWSQLWAPANRSVGDDTCAAMQCTAEQVLAEPCTGDSRRCITCRPCCAQLQPCRALHSGCVHCSVCHSPTRCTRQGPLQCSRRCCRGQLGSESWCPAPQQQQQQRAGQPMVHVSTNNGTPANLYCISRC